MLRGHGSTTFLLSLRKYRVMSTPLQPLLVRLTEISWRYLGEGNRHLVLAIDSGRVLRLHKNETNTETLRAAVQFVNHVMLPLILNESFIEAEQLITLATEDVDKLNESLTTVRHPSRAHKIICSQLATMAPNYTLVPGAIGTSYCVEIKPKFGIMQHELYSYGKCSYCLKQYLKLASNQIARITQYCPLDLFSGSRPRMIRSLLNLTQDPQNNFRIFRNSQTIFNETSPPETLNDILEELPVFKDLISLIRFLVDILLLNQYLDNNHIVEQSSESYIDKTLLQDKCDNTKVSLDSNSILSRILALQKMWIKNETVEITHENDFSYVHPLLLLMGQKNRKLNVEYGREEFLKECDALCCCMMAAVARDCSIMVAFSESPSAEWRARRVFVGGHHLTYSVAVTDLEPKPTSTMEKRKRVDSDMIKAFEKAVLKKQH